MTFFNSGNEASKEIDFKIFEDEKQSIAPEECQNVVFTAGESKSFTTPSAFVDTIIKL
jgi:hypothetical protein